MEPVTNIKLLFCCDSVREKILCSFNYWLRWCKKVWLDGFVNPPGCEALTLQSSVAAEGSIAVGNHAVVVGALALLLIAGALVADEAVHADGEHQARCQDQDNEFHLWSTSDFELNSPSDFFSNVRDATQLLSF